MTFKVYLSLSRDPFHHIAWEEWLLEHVIEIKQPILALYVNNPCVVLGRFQNPLLEINFDYLKEKRTWARRFSGGGTVFHDQGNLNFCFIHPHRELLRRQNLEYICECLNCADLEIAEKFDLLLKGKKISGSAFKQKKDASLHHGTLLISSQLSNLRNALNVSDYSIETKAIPSRPASVANLNDFDAISMKTVIEKLSKRKHEEVDPLDLISLDRLNFYQSDEWKWHETPKFSLPLENKKAMIHKGELSWTDIDTDGKLKLNDLVTGINWPIRRQ